MKSSASTVEKICTICNKRFRIFACRDWREHQCSSGCKVEARRLRSAILRLERARICIECDAEFVIKHSQIINDEGKYCSISCATKAYRRTPEFAVSRKKSGATYKSNLASGKFTRRNTPTGDQSPYWKGGVEATNRRMKDRGALQAYRTANPDKVREWSQRRRGRKTGRLPRGTVKFLLEKQRCRCAICTKSIKAAYHVDHIMPLALGGMHEPLNIQILCPTCNVRKNAKHPIRYAQELGRLL